jgi:hypothetical protein
MIYLLAMYAVDLFPFILGGLFIVWVAKKLLA